MTIKTRIRQLERGRTPRRTWLDFITDDSTTLVIHDDSAGLQGAEMTPAEYADYSKAHPGPVITILERGSE